MSDNSSSNASLPAPFLSPSTEMFSLLYSCLNTTAGALTFTTFTIISSLLLLPLCTFILYMGLQRWRQRASNMTMSHADVFTYHMVVAELLTIMGFTAVCCGLHADVPQMMKAGTYLFSINLTGQILFHILTCVERYLAVVHPITYLSLRTAKGIRIRNVAIGCVWLMCLAGLGQMSMNDGGSIVIITSYCSIFLLLIVISFCSLSVLCVLIRPGPREGGGDRRQVDQSKLRAFYTITAILGVLVFRLGGSVVGTSLFSLSQLEESAKCALSLSVIWFGLPSSLVLPLLFLHRAGKLLCCQNSSESGRGSG